jgi:hypothetical protein
LHASSTTNLAQYYDGYGVIGPRNSLDDVPGKVSSLKLTVEAMNPIGQVPLTVQAYRED